MKHLLVLFMLSIALQPVQLQACSMEMDQEMQHHASMQDDAGHDCCATDTEDSTHNCNDVMQCGSCSLLISLIPFSAGAEVSVLSGRYLVFNDNRPLAPPIHPLLRPPIA